MSRNIDHFDQYAAQVLGNLYEAFPVKCSLDARELSGHFGEGEFGEIVRPDGRPSKEAEIAYATLEWLMEADFIRCEDRNPPYGAAKCVLTVRGLEVLKAVPDRIQAQETLGDRLANLARSGSLDAAREVVRTVLGTITGRLV